ncbi:MAG: hypothetical protein KO206_01675 [Methanomicrobiaceae archaeon]|uniref:DUF1616 domain-containing protein n=1 Tax=hydrocarbon metagenome TaxID=938273 RepID=A0A0W8FJ13_9ZZZZ|nr:hypothetical protein [Methanomicrobiaceae archaeon]
MDENEWDEHLYPMIRTAAIVATVVGVLTVAFFLIIADEPYSALYLVPDPSPYALDGNDVLFTYGVTSNERGKTAYVLEFYADDTLYGSETFEIRRGETYESEARVQLPPNATYPLKIRVDLKAESGSTESVHFWVREQAG